MHENQTIDTTTTEQATTPLKVLRPIAPEDIAIGQFICTMALAIDRIPCAEPALPGTTDQRAITTWIRSCAPEPLKVIGICLPLILTSRHDKSPEIIDLRREEVARVPRKFARLVRDELRAEDKRRRKSPGFLLF